MTRSAMVAGRGPLGVSQLSLALVGAALISHLAAGLSGPAAGLTWRILNGALFAGCSALTAAMLWRAARAAADERTSLAWQRLAVAQAIATLGDLAWLGARLRGGELLASLADTIYLIAYPLALWALISFPTARSSRAERPGLIIDIAALAVGGGMIIWYLLLAAAPAGPSPHDLAIAIAYQVGDLALLLGFALVMMRRPSSLDRLSQLLILGWLGCLLGGDLGLALLGGASARAESWADACWLAGNLLLIGAAARAGGPGLRPAARALSLPLPYITLAAGYVLLIIAAGDYYAEPIGGLILGSALLTALLIARQIMALRLNMRLLAERAEAEARERASAEAANRAKSEFLALMSHELRTPLTAILGYSELLTFQAADRGLDDILPEIQEIERAGHQLLDIVNNVLDMARLESGRLALSPQPFDLGVFAADLEPVARSLAGANGNQLRVAIQPELGSVNLDQIRLRQSLMYLLSNACKFTENGTVTLRVGRDADPSWIIFEVADTGIGIAPEQIGQLFQPFHQADSGLARQYGGSGLGLALSHRICLLMGGSISVVSAPQSGTTFTMRIPAPAV